MEWADGIEVGGGVLLASVVSPKGQRDSVSLSEIYRTGLPKAVGKRPSLRGFALNQLKAVPPNDYLSAFGFGQRSDASSRHQVYELYEDGERILIPALSLMRGLFVPSRLLLPDMFMPQVLDHLAVSDPSSPEGIRIVAPWVSELGRQNVFNPTSLIRWLMLDQQAREMATSVHRNAIAGRIDLKLPAVRADLSLTGLRKADTFYATACTVSKLEASAVAGMEHEGATVTTVHLRGNNASTEQKSVKGLVSIDDIPLRQSGGQLLSDEEWNALNELLSTKRKNAVLPGLLRAVFNAILSKHVNGTSWHDVEVPGLSSEAVVYYYRKWVASGAFHEAMNVLRQFRSV